MFKFIGTDIVTTYFFHCDIFFILIKHHKKIIKIHEILGLNFYGFSIAAQTDLLNDYAEKYNFEIVKEFSEAETAKDIGRHKFKEMVQYLKKNKDVKTILVEKTDRLYRNFYDYVDLDVDKTG